MIQVNIDQKSTLNLDIFNTLWQLVFSATKSKVNAGSFSFELNADNFEASVYFYTITAKNTKVTNKDDRPKIASFNSKLYLDFLQKRSKFR